MHGAGMQGGMHGAGMQGGMHAGTHGMGGEPGAGMHGKGKEDMQGAGMHGKHGMQGGMHGKGGMAAGGHAGGHGAAPDADHGARSRRLRRRLTRAGRAPRACYDARVVRPIRAFVLLLPVAFAATVSLAQAAEPRVLRTMLQIAETSFDPAFASDAASVTVIAEVFDSMLDYDYLARPATLVPRALVALPTTDDGGKTWTCRVKPGIRFAPDPAFGGKPRELTAADFAYTYKRILDPAVKSPWSWLFEGKIAGVAAAREAAKKSGRFDYDAKFPGLEVVDRYTLKIRLDAPDLRFPYVLAVPVHRRGRARGRRGLRHGHRREAGRHRSVPARRVQAQLAHGARAQSRATARETYVPAGPIPADAQADRRRAEGHASCRCSTGSRSAVIEEAQSRWLAFLNGEVDVDALVSAQLDRRAARRRQAQARARGEGHPARGARAAEHLLVLLQHGRPARRRDAAGEGRAAARDLDGLRRGRGAARAVERPRHPGADARPARASPASIRR